MLDVPTLSAVEETAFGCNLVLSDGHIVPVNVSRSRLVDAMTAQSRCLAEVLALKEFAVFTGVFLTAPEEWLRISDLILNCHRTKTTLGSHPAILAAFHDTYEVVRATPHRVYGALDQALYTSHPYNFRPDANRAEPWRVCTLNAPGGRLFQTSVDLSSGAVEIVTDVIPGHFVE